MDFWTDMQISMGIRKTLHFHDNVEHWDKNIATLEQCIGHCSKLTLEVVGCLQWILPCVKELEEIQPKVKRVQGMLAKHMEMKKSLKAVCEKAKATEVERAKLLSEVEKENQTLTVARDGLVNLIVKYIEMVTTSQEVINNLEADANRSERIMATFSREREGLYGELKRYVSPNPEPISLEDYEDLIS